MGAPMRNYVRTKKHAQKHVSESTPGKEAEKRLPLVYTIVPNLNRELLGIHHKLKNHHGQNYLNVFCYKTNRR